MSVKKEYKEFTDINWGRAQPAVRDYFSLLARIEESRLPEGFKREQYGEVTYDGQSYPLVRIVSSEWNPALPSAMITGGVHGCEPAGVEGAMTCIKDVLPSLSKEFNFVVYPCVSPTGYEMDRRWNYLKQDPNRNFKEGTEVEECQLLIDAAKQMGPMTVLLDLHESLQKDAGTMRIQARDLGNPKAAAWNEIPTGYFIYEEAPSDGQGGWHRIGPKIVEAAAQFIPPCIWPEIAGDRNDGGVIYYPQGINVATSDYSTPTALPDYLKHIGLAGHAFTSETPDLLEDGRVLSVDQRAAGHVAAVRAALDALKDPKYPRMKLG